MTALPRRRPFALQRVGALVLATACLTACLMFPWPTQAREAVLEVNGTASEDDDYLCWSAVPARIKLAENEESQVNVTLRGEGGPASGAIWLQASSNSRPTRATFSPQEEITLSLPGDGGWIGFWVAGRRPSTGDKDVNVVALDDAGFELARLPVMVRVRKDAQRLTGTEINQFLAALAELHDLDNGALASEFVKHPRAHDEAFWMGIHGGPDGQPLFLAWHRAFLLNLERELQFIDRRVALPYWRFDQPAPALFTPDFMGAVAGGASTAGGFLVEFSATNPLRGWRMPDGGGGLVRVRDAAGTAPIPEDRLGELFVLPFNASYNGVNGAIENGYHNGAHSFIRGWLGSGSSPRDPLFYLLHANVDRAWAHWQAQFDRFDAADSASYSAQGTYPGPTDPSRFRKGSYAEDAMWPWSGTGGNQGTLDPRDDWPGFSYAMPTSWSGEGPTNPPTPARMIDYLDLAGQGLSHTFCYDDIDYLGDRIDPDEE